jgi:type II secretory pathway pseudopilin PulG
MSRTPRKDGGFTLVELLVYMLLFGIVGTMVVMLVWNGYRSQLNVTETTYNSGNLQNAALALDHDVRYSAAFSVTEGGAMLRTRSWVGDPETGAFECHGWYADSSNNTLRRGTGSGITSGATAASAASWPRYADGVEAVTAFTAVDSRTVQVRLTGVPDAWGRNTVIDTSIVQRPQSSDGSGTCF